MKHLRILLFLCLASSGLADTTPVPGVLNFIKATSNSDALSKLNAIGVATQAELTAARADNEALKTLVSGEGYQLTAITRDSDGVATTAAVLWPDGVTGVFTTTAKNATFLAIDAFTITYAGAVTKTITQAAVTRDAEGAVTIKPALTITP